VQFLKDGVLGGAQSGRRQGVVKLRHTPHDLAHCRCAAWAFLACLNAPGTIVLPSSPSQVKGIRLLYNKGHMP
jgi:hypothetical protein